MTDHLPNPPSCTPLGECTCKCLRCFSGGHCFQGEEPVFGNCPAPATPSPRHAMPTAMLVLEFAAGMERETGTSLDELVLPERAFDILSAEVARHTPKVGAYTYPEHPCGPMVAVGGTTVRRMWQERPDAKAIAAWLRTLPSPQDPARLADEIEAVVAPSNRP